MLIPEKHSIRIPSPERRASIRVLDISELPTLRQPVPRPRKQRSLYLKQEVGVVVFILFIALLSRLYAAFTAGLEVDEPIYRDAAAFTLQYGYPSIRPAYLHPTTPFLYHPPFFLFLLAGWFKLWNNTSYLTGRMGSISTSLLMLLLLYLCTRQILGRRVALIALVLVANDVWIIFINQAIYLENSLMIIVILSIWSYCCASRQSPTMRLSYLGWYALTGLLIGFAIIYKQIGGFLVPVVFLNLLLQRKHWHGHAVLGGAALFVVTTYILEMHLAFGAIYDTATLDQVFRTIGAKAAPGLNDSPLAVLLAVWNRYWIFFITIVTLASGSVFALIQYIQVLLRRRENTQTVIISWALGGLVFALGISLKSPHYMILWLIPLYLVLAQLYVSVFCKGSISFPTRIAIPKLSRNHVPGLLLCALILLCNAWSFQARFMHIPGDSLQEAEEYMNTTLPPTAVVLTENYIGVDLVPQFLDINLITTPKQILQHGVSYMALYWSDTEPIPSSLGPFNRYCLPMKQFVGFKDHVQVCKINGVALAAIVNPPVHSTRNTP